MFCFHYLFFFKCFYKLSIIHVLKKMVAGVFVYPHLFSPQKTNVSDRLTSDSPTRFLNRLVSVLVAVATLPLWEGLFRHTDPTPSSEKIKRVVTAPPVIKRKMSYHPCPVCQASRHGGRWRREVAKPLLANSNSKNKKVSGDEKAQPRNLFVLSQPRLTSSMTQTIT